MLVFSRQLMIGKLMHWPFTRWLTQRMFNIWCIYTKGFRKAFINPSFGVSATNDWHPQPPRVKLRLLNTPTALVIGWGVRPLLWERFEEQNVPRPQLPVNAGKSYMAEVWSISSTHGHLLPSDANLQKPRLYPKQIGLSWGVLWWHPSGGPVDALPSLSFFPFPFPFLSLGFLGSRSYGAGRLDFGIGIMRKWTAGSLDNMANGTSTGLVPSGRCATLPLVLSDIFFHNMRSASLACCIVARLQLAGGSRCKFSKSFSCHDSITWYEQMCAKSKALARRCKACRTWISPEMVPTWSFWAFDSLNEPEASKVICKSFLLLTASDAL